ncbi:TlpA disulfide reductase family protein [Ferrimonas aestuarii]|uniref:TlpA disulfide reductase family protein n=1 Tax=Ferrimonas aestuarii TaxID=2569539 RepID=UPI00145EFB00|nr:TlpA disulfide reductase family protein [Ferrimonas aestuarii]
MRTLLSLFLTLSFAAAVAAKPAPDFSLKPNLQQSLIEVSQKGPVYLDFWASWCGPCRRSFPFMNELVAQYQPEGLTVIAVNLDVEKQDADNFLTQFPANFTIVYDPEFTIADAYKVAGMPSSYLIYKGEIIEQHVGFREKDAEATHRTLKKLFGN